ncbi:MAG: phosphoribosylformylglycinamidine synthase I [Armatimonadota bacterium]
MAAQENGHPNVALLQFPGSNCELETKRAAEAGGLHVDIFRWNRHAESLRAYDGYLIGGGFSYQDRVRAGAIATKEPIVRTLAEEVEKGKPCLGICNGAQVLVEAGLIPGIHPRQVEMALAYNRPDPATRISYYCCKWVHLKLAAPARRCRLTACLPDGLVWPVPLSHGEGRYTTSDPALLDVLIENDQVVFQYCSADGEVDDRPEINPNGSTYNIAALCNPRGNVLAIMPHPERASWLRQIPLEIGGPWAQRKLQARGDPSQMTAPGPGRLIFDSLRQACAEARGAREADAPSRDPLG